MVMKKKLQKVTVGFISLGCPKNSVDSERMLAQIAEAGFAITAEPETADIVVINTCGFIAPAKTEFFVHEVQLFLAELEHFHFAGGRQIQSPPDLAHSDRQDTVRVSVFHQVHGIGPGDGRGFSAL